MQVSPYGSDDGSWFFAQSVESCAHNAGIQGSLEYLFNSPPPNLRLRDSLVGGPPNSTDTFDSGIAFPERFRSAAAAKEESQDGRPAAGEWVGLSLPLWHEICFVALICLAMFTTQVGLGQTLNIMYIIGNDFGISQPGILGWFTAGYSLTVGTFILIAGRLGDLFGYRKMLVIGYAWFALWTMVVGLSVYSNHVLFIFARVLSGIGPAITMPNAMAIVGAAYPEGLRKSMVFALFGACAPSGSIVGAAFAGLFTLGWWPWTFWSFSIVIAVIASLCAVTIPDVQQRLPIRRTWEETFTATDSLGAILGVTSLVLINFAWNQAGVVGWQQPYVYFCLVLGVAVFLPAFLYIEIKVSKAPLIPFYALSREVGVVLACVACGWASLGIWLFYLVQFYLLLRGGSPLLVSAWFSSIAASGLLASITTGLLLSKIRATWVMVLSMTFFTVGLVLTVTAPVSQTYWAQTFVCALVMPFGMDMSFPAAAIIMSNSVPKEHQGVAASLVVTIVNYSISLGLGFATTVESSVNPESRAPTDLLRGFRSAWYIGLGLASVGLVISGIFAIKGVLLNRR